MYERWVPTYYDVQLVDGKSRTANRITRQYSGQEKMHGPFSASFNGFQCFCFGVVVLVETPILVDKVE